MTPRFTEEHDLLLSRLEQLELRWLSWGRVDGGVAEDEALALADEISRSGNGAGLIDDLLDSHLVLDVGASTLALRSRFAEGVRLQVRLRQLLHGKGWQGAPQLVNDFRVLARPRYFPRRDVTIDEFMRAAGDDADPLTDAEVNAIRGMLDDGGRAIRLSQFQVDAGVRIRNAIRDRSQSGTVVSAGTGAGKTKAFYLPVLGRLVADHDSERWVRVLAIYPRNELLKDQFTEALSQLEMIASSGGPVLAVGALFGPTATQAKRIEHNLDDQSGWECARESGGFSCRYLRCPQGCSEDLVWGLGDLRAGIERLECPRCHWRSREGQLVLTRQGLQERPPEVLFTTTEMLNRGLADAYLRPIFVGPGPERRPRVLLLDEIHTYGGVHGAQVALLLRRWRKALGPTGPLHVVGLSATLDGPGEFLARLTGLAEVEVVQPRAAHLEAASAEYALILRGNPVSGTALLSTTIQSTFLLARLLERRDGTAERTGTSGSRVFAFTDNLDVTNRLFWDLNNAELNARGPLAALRDPGAFGDRAVRQSDGQIWELPQLLGWPLNASRRLAVRRTSSQDAGVDLDADVVVATSSLEVGFDDPEVGGVVQHKAPRDDAAFIQRKGRAGRQLTMRPWTVVVLSDYGRDRASYQAYETLFAPRLSPSTLPIDSMHVLKMQAAFALLDWLVEKVPGLRARVDLTVRSNKTAQLRRQRMVARLLRDVLEDPKRERELERHLRRALDLSREQARDVMWKRPREIMTAVIPTLLRRLDSNWGRASGGSDGPVWDVPLPEFAPRALFSDLNLPEVSVEVPPRDPKASPKHEQMPVVQALTEFVPGRSSRRFGVRATTEWHWVPVDLDGAGSATSNVVEWIRSHRIVGAVSESGAGDRPLWRPWAINLSRTPRDKQSQNARPEWITNIDTSQEGWRLEVPRGSGQSHVIPELKFHTHALGNEARVSRGIGRVAVEDPDGLTRIVELVASDGGIDEPVAVGFTAEIDAVDVVIRKDVLPGFDALGARAQRSVRTSWFENALQTDPGLQARASRFTISWLGSLFLAAMAGVATKEGLESAAATVRRIAEIGTRKCLQHALSAVFAASATPTSTEDDGRGMARLNDVLANEENVKAIEGVARKAAEGAGTDLDGFTRAMAISTIGGAFREAFQRLVPSFEADVLAIDVVDDEDEVHLWLSEPDVGSSGTIEEIRRRVAEEPGRLIRLLTAAVGAADLEVVDAEVSRALQRAGESETVGRAFRDVREAATAEATSRAQADLRDILRSEGISTDHAVLSALNLRVLRPGSSPDTDTVLKDALETWDEIEDALGFEFDARSVAYAASRESELSLEQVYSLLWPRGREARRSGIDVWSRFSSLAPADRLTIESLVAPPAVRVEFGPEAISEMREGLLRAGLAVIVGAGGDTPILQEFLRKLVMEPLDVGSVSAYPRLVAAVRRGSKIEVSVELQEAIA